MCLGGSLVWKSYDAKAEPDFARLNTEAAARLTGAGFDVMRRRDPLWPVAAVRGNCKILVGAAALRPAMFYQLQATADGSEVNIGYRGRWSNEPPDFWVSLDVYFQERLLRVGITTNRPAVIATAQRGECAGLQAILGGMRVWPLRDTSDGPFTAARSDR